MQYPGRVIKLGDTDPIIVTEIQNQLNARGCGPLDPIGTFGPKTNASVKLFQARNVDLEGNTLKVDGKVGPLTWGALFGNDTVPVSGISSPYLGAVIAKASTQLGVREQPKNSNSGPEVDEYLLRAGVSLDLDWRDKPWCCAFVYWCFDETARAQGRPNPMARTAVCLEHWDLAVEHEGRRVRANDGLNNPTLVAPGMVFIMDYGGGKGHTGFIESVNGALLHTIEGNTDGSGTNEGGGVYRLVRKMAAINKGYIEYPK